MPYVITITLPCPACVHGPAGGGEHRPDSVSRRAVATLEEAIAYVAEIRHDFARDVPTCDYCLSRTQADITESGGTVGPLPDGTVIEVEQVEWAVLYRALTPGKLGLPRTNAFPGGMEPVRRKVLAAYNAAQGARA